MIRTAVPALGVQVDILEWDGNVEELRSFTPDEIYGVDEDGNMRTGFARARITGDVPRFLRPGDLLIRPAGRADVSPLHLFRDSWWATALGFIDE